MATNLGPGLASPPFQWGRAPGLLQAITFALAGFFMARTGWREPVPVLTAGAALLTAGIGCVAWLQLRKPAPPLILVPVAGLSVCGAALALVWPASQGWIVLFWAASAAAARLTAGLSIGLVAADYVLFLMMLSRGQAVAGPFNVASWWAGLAFAGIWIIGRQRRQQRLHIKEMERLMAELAEAHAQLQVDARQAAALAAAEERNRIAREIHDVLAHSLTVLVVQAQAIKRLVRADPEAAERQALQLADLARNGLQEARRSVTALRTEAPGVDGLARLQNLVADFGRGTGTSTAFRLEGDASAVSAGAWATLYRVTQEALTNAQRHGQAKHVAVSLHVDGAVRLTVEDDGSALQAPVPGNGLRGMHERAERLGGGVTYGPRPDGGFRVMLELPA